MISSNTYAPPPDLSPFVRRLFVISAKLPDDFVLIDRLISETAMIRILLTGSWSAQFAHNNRFRPEEGTTVLFGPNSRTFTARLVGAFTVAGVALRPSGWGALFDFKASDIADDMFSLSDFWGADADELYARTASAQDHPEIVAAIESILRKRLIKAAHFPIDPAIKAFEEIVRDDCTMRVADVAARLGLSGSALERRCRATYGLTPKAILRRSRFLDMAAAARGMSNPDDEERAALRFSDQSHLNREYRHFIDMTPLQFLKAETPLLNAVLQLRVAGLG